LFENLFEADLLRVRHSLLQRCVRPTAVEVGDVHCVTGRPQLVGERANSGGQTLSVVEEQHIGHGRSPGGENGFVALTLSERLA
jgi:hypothetical protein